MIPVGFTVQSHPYFLVIALIYRSSVMAQAGRHNKKGKEKKDTTSICSEIVHRLRMKASATKILFDCLWISHYDKSQP